MGIQKAPAVSGGSGTPLAEYHHRNARPKFQTNQRLVQVVGAMFDYSHCQTWKDVGETDQCGAYPVKSGDHAGVLCAGHINALEKASADSRET